MNKQQKAREDARKVSIFIEAAYAFTGYDVLDRDSYVPDLEIDKRIARKKKQIRRSFHKDFSDFDYSDFYIIVCNKKNIAKVTSVLNKYGWANRAKVNLKGNTVTFGRIEKEPQQSIVEFAKNADPMEELSLSVNKTAERVMELPSSIFQDELNERLIKMDLVLSTEKLKNQR